MLGGSNPPSGTFDNTPCGLLDCRGRKDQTMTPTEPADEYDRSIAVESAIYECIVHAVHLGEMPRAEDFPTEIWAEIQPLADEILQAARHLGELAFAEVDTVIGR